MHLCGICISRHPSKETFALDREYRLAVTRRHGPSVGHEDNIYWGNLILRYALPSRLWSGRTRKQSNSLALPSISKKVGTRCRSPSYERLLKECSSPFTRLAEHLAALRAWRTQCLLGW